MRQAARTKDIHPICNECYFACGDFAKSPARYQLLHIPSSLHVICNVATCLTAERKRPDWIILRMGAAKLYSARGRWLTLAGKRADLTCRRREPGR